MVPPGYFAKIQHRWRGRELFAQARAELASYSQRRAEIELTGIHEKKIRRVASELLWAVGGGRWDGAGAPADKNQRTEIGDQRSEETLKSYDPDLPFVPECGTTARQEG